MIWHRYALVAQFITIIESPKTCRALHPFSTTKSKSIFNAINLVNLFVPSPTPILTGRNGSLRNKNNHSPHKREALLGMLHQRNPMGSIFLFPLVEHYEWIFHHFLGENEKVYWYFERPPLPKLLLYPGIWLFSEWSICTKTKSLENPWEACVPCWITSSASHLCKNDPTTVNPSPSFWPLHPMYYE